MVILKRGNKQSANRGLEDANALREALLQTIPFRMDIVDEDGNIQFINEKIEAIVGKDAIGKKCWALYRDDKKQCSNCPLIRGINVGETATIESEGVFGGRIFKISHTGMIYKGKKAVLEIFQDITEHRRMEDELRQANKQLHVLDKLKSDFVATVSHELRTPMSIVKESISQVLEGIHGEVSLQQKKFLTISLDNIDRLTRIANNLLDISKIEAGKIELNRESVDIVELAKTVISGFSVPARNTGIQLKTNFNKDKIALYIDKDRIIQVFTNLINNSLKFTQKGYIEISVVDKEDFVECSVYDTGKGVAQEDLPKVFSKFQQFERMEGPGEKGTGLGLSIAKGVIELHNGKIWIESKAGEGTKVSFILPKIKAAVKTGDK